MQIDWRLQSIWKITGEERLISWRDIHGHFNSATQLLPKRKNLQVIGEDDMLWIEIASRCKIGNNAPWVLLSLLFLLISVTANKLCWPSDYSQQGVLKKKIWLS